MSVTRWPHSLQVTGWGAHDGQVVRDGAAISTVHPRLVLDTGKGNRPSFSEAAPAVEAEPVYERFCSDLEALGIVVARGVFGASMAVELVNDGPVTIVL